MRTSAAILAMVAGCSLYTNSSDDTCTIVPLALTIVRDPHTGECIPRSPGACGSCVPCPLDVDPTEDYAACYGPCQALSEQDCLVAPSCRVAYEVDPRGNSATFLGCWEIETLRPPPSAACAELDVLWCPYRGDCAAWYVPADGTRRFDHCADEPGPESCDPPTSTCTTRPPPCPLDYVPTTRNGCYTGHCIARSECPQAACAALAGEAQCTARGDCEPIYRGDNCTCTPTSCTCETRTYEHCADRPG